MNVEEELAVLSLVRSEESCYVGAREVKMFWVSLLSIFCVLTSSALFAAQSNLGTPTAEQLPLQFLTHGESALYNEFLAFTNVAVHDDKASVRELRWSEGRLLRVAEWLSLSAGPLMSQDNMLRRFFYGVSCAGSKRVATLSVLTGAAQVIGYSSDPDFRERLAREPFFVDYDDWVQKHIDLIKDRAFERIYPLIKKGDIESVWGSLPEVIDSISAASFCSPILSYVRLLYLWDNGLRQILEKSPLLKSQKADFYNLTALMGARSDKRDVVAFVVALQELSQRALWSKHWLTNYTIFKELIELRALIVSHVRQLEGSLRRLVDQHIMGKQGGRVTSHSLGLQHNLSVDEVTTLDWFLEFSQHAKDGDVHMPVVGTAKHTNMVEVAWLCFKIRDKLMPPVEKMRRFIYTAKSQAAWTAPQDILTGMAALLNLSVSKDFLGLCANVRGVLDNFFSVADVLVPHHLEPSYYKGLMRAAQRGDICEEVRLSIVGAERALQGPLLAYIGMVRAWDRFRAVLTHRISGSPEKLEALQKLEKKMPHLNDKAFLQCARCFIKLMRQGYWVNKRWFVDLYATVVDLQNSRDKLIASLHDFLDDLEKILKK